MTDPARTSSPLPALALLPLLAGVGVWLFTWDWRWAALGLLGMVATAVVLAVVVRPGGPR